MAQVKVNVEGNGVFQIDIAKVGELLGWLSANQAVSIQEDNKIQEVKNNEFTGRTLINDWYDY